MKNKDFFTSIRCAVRGAWKAVRTERNFVIYLLLALLSTPLNIWLDLTGVQVLILFVCLCGALSAESINTAVEKLCDLISPEYSESIRFIKDVAASGVMWWGVAYFGVEFIMIGMKLFA